MMDAARPPALVPPQPALWVHASPAPRRWPSLGLDGWAAAIVLLLLGLVVLAGPLVWPIDPDRMQLARKFAAPSLQSPLGTDDFGRDLLARLIHGGRLSLAGALAVLVGTSGIGFAIGALAGSTRGKVDSVISRAVDGLLALPTLVVALALVGVLGKAFENLLLALVLTGWPWYARAYRGLFVQESHQQYVLAARALGASPLRIIWRHMAPNVAGPAMVLVTTNFGGAILSLAGLSFLGLGVQPPQAEWGAMINAARPYFQTEPWIITLPGAAIAVTVLAVNLLGDALRDVLDPRHRP